MDMPKRIISIQHRHHPGGVCKRMYLTVQGLLEAGYEVHYLSVDPLRLDEHPRLFRHEIPVWVKRRRGLIYWSIFSITAPLVLAGAMLRRRFAALIVFSPYYCLIASTIATLLMVPSIVFLRTIPNRLEPAYRSAIAGRVRYWAAWAGLFTASRVVVFSRSVREALAARSLLLRRKLRLLRPPVTLPPALSGEEGAQTRAEAARKHTSESPAFRDWIDGFAARKSAVCRMFDFPERSLIMLVSGELSDRKNAELVLRAMNAIEGERPVLIISGQGAEGGRLRTAAAGFGLKERVVIEGWLPNFADVLTGCDLYVLPSKYDGISNSMLEALGAGVPVLAADTPEMREILRYDELLFDAGHVGKLAERIEAIADSKAEREKVRQLSRYRARELTFSWGAELSHFIESRFA